MVSYHGKVVLKDTLCGFCPLLVKKNQENLSIADVCKNNVAEKASSLNICTHPSTDVMSKIEQKWQNIKNWTNAALFRHLVD